MNPSGRTDPGVAAEGAPSMDGSGSTPNPSSTALSEQTQSLRAEGMGGASVAESTGAGPDGPGASDSSCQSEDAGPQVYHYGVALHGIANEHADVLTPRQRKALYEAGNLLWDSPAARPSLQITGDQ